MAIKRLQISEGAPIWGPTNPNNLAVRLWRERSSDINILSPGYYDVTPEPHKNRVPNSQQLTVMENGTAVYRIFAIGHAALTKLKMRGPGSIDQLPEGRGDIIHMPSDASGRLVIGDMPGRANKGRLFLYDVIIWSPEDNQDSEVLTSAAQLNLSSELISTY